MTEHLLVARVRKLLALATSPNEHEATAALVKAQELIRRHNLDLAAAPSESERVVRAWEPINPASGNRPWREALATAVARANLCEAIMDDESSCAWFVGRPQNVEAVREIFRWAQAQLNVIARTEERAAKRTWVGPWPASWRQGFLLAAVERVEERLQEANTTPDPRCTALAVRHHEGNLAFIHKTWGRRVKLDETIRGVGVEAYRRGRQAGDWVDLHPPLRSIPPHRRALAAGR